MKKLLSVILALLAVSAPALAASERSKPKKAKVKLVSPAVMKKALAALKTFNAEIDTKAKFYIYLQSASWCGPCRQKMPELAKMYPDMKKKKVELILISADRDEESALKFLTDNEAKFPGVMAKDAAVADLPGFVAASGIPNAIVVNARGKVLFNGNGAAVSNWQKIIKQR